MFLIGEQQQTELDRTNTKPNECRWIQHYFEIIFPKCCKIFGISDSNHDQIS